MWIRIRIFICCGWGSGCGCGSGCGSRLPKWSDPDPEHLCRVLLFPLVWVTLQLLVRIRIFMESCDFATCCWWNVKFLTSRTSMVYLLIKAYLFPLQCLFKLFLWEICWRLFCLNINSKFTRLSWAARKRSLFRIRIKIYWSATFLGFVSQALVPVYLITLPVSLIRTRCVRKQMRRAK